MRSPTPAEQIKLDQRKASFDLFLQECFEVLVDFIEKLELPQPALVLQDAEKYLKPINDWMRIQTVKSEDRIWIITRLAYFIGELLNQRFDGNWLIDPDPESPYFTQYVIGQFANIPNPYIRISPFGIAAFYVDQSPGSSLIDVINRADKDLRNS